MLGYPALLRRGKEAANFEAPVLYNKLLLHSVWALGTFDVWFKLTAVTELFFKIEAERKQRVAAKSLGC